MIENHTRHIRRGGDLTRDEMTEVIDGIVHGDCDESAVAEFLLALGEKGETFEEIAGAAAALRRNMTRIETSRTGLLDTCGTGGDGSRTMNISTAAALVAAAAGVPVAKHGNRGISSRSGSADVLALLGVNIEADVQQVENCLERLGICFCFAPLLHRSMKHVAQVRRRLGVPTIFNLLGPLCNPAGAAMQLLGVGRPGVQEKMARALMLLGTERSILVRGEDGLDEISPAAPTRVLLCQGGRMEEFTWRSGDFGIEPFDVSALTVDSPEQSAEMIHRVLDGREGPARQVVILNAAAALWLARRDPEPVRCAALAAEAIDSGAASELLQRLGEVSRA